MAKNKKKFQEKKIIQGSKLNQREKNIKRKELIEDKVSELEGNLQRLKEAEGASAKVDDLRIGAIRSQLEMLKKELRKLKRQIQ